MRALLGRFVGSVALGAGTRGPGRHALAPHAAPRRAAILGGGRVAVRPADVRLAAPRRWARALAACAALLLLGPLTSARATGDDAAGRAVVRDFVCQECHGADGLSTLPEYPRLAGQSATYLLKQLQDFQSGRRRHQIMNAMADGIALRDLQDIAAHYASQPAMHGTAATPNPLGRRLVEEGDPVRGIPACAGCHGAAGRGGVVEGVPVIGGQHRFYLRGQLLDWKSGTRRNSPGEVMNGVAARLAAEDIEALADYLAAVPTEGK